MKKLLGIIVLGLLWQNLVLANDLAIMAFNKWLYDNGHQKEDEITNNNRKTYFEFDIHERTLDFVNTVKQIRQKIETRKEEGKFINTELKLLRNDLLSCMLRDENQWNLSRSFRFLLFLGLTPH